MIQATNGNDQDAPQPTYGPPVFGEHAQESLKPTSSSAEKLFECIIGGLT
jgi:hypothetical protein